MSSTWTSVPWRNNVLWLKILSLMTINTYYSYRWLSWPCVCGTQVLQCWSAEWRNAAMSPCQCESGQCEPRRSAPRPPPRTWNETRWAHVTSAVGARKQSLLMDDQSKFSPDLEDLPRLFFGVRGGGDDEQAIQQVDRDAMGALIVCAADTERQRKRIFSDSSKLIQNKVTQEMRWEVK